VLLIPLVGWRVAGVVGAAIALAAFTLPSTAIAVGGARLLRRHEASRAVATLRWALRPVGGGLMLAASVEVFFSAAHAWPESSPASTFGLAAIALPVALAAIRIKANPLVWIAAAAAIGCLVPLR
jgi:chromate transporter